MEQECVELSFIVQVYLKLAEELVSDKLEATIFGFQYIVHTNLYSFSSGSIKRTSFSVPRTFMSTILVHQNLYFCHYNNN